MGSCDRFRFVGHVDNDDLCRYLCLSDFVLLPSEAEAMSLTALEAMACGRFVIASDIPAAQELIEDGQDGFRFSTGAAAMFAEKLRYAAASADRRRQLGLAARRKAVEQYSLSGLLARWRKVFDDMGPSQPRSDRLG